MADGVVPTKNVTYWIQNLDFGTFLGIVDEMPVSRSLNKATFVTRPKKDNAPTQEWIIQDAGNGQWAIVNNGSNYYVNGTSSDATVTNFNIRNGVPTTGRVTIEQENDTKIVKIITSGGTLQATDGFTLKIGDDGDEDKMKWRLIEKCTILGQVGYKYRLRGLNGRILNLDNAGTYSAMVLADAAKVATNKTLWSIEPAPGGHCTIKLVGGGANDYLSCKSVYTKGQDNWIIDKGAEYQWDIESIGNFAYQIVKHGDTRQLALTVENDTDIILKPNKVGHGQIWLVERDYN